MNNLFFNFFWTSNYKRKGILYFLFGVFAGFISVLLSLLIRMQLAFSNNSFLGENYQFYNMIVIMHGIIMLFFLIVYTNFGYLWNLIFLSCFLYNTLQRCKHFLSLFIDENRSVYENKFNFYPILYHMIIWLQELKYIFKFNIEIHIKNMNPKMSTVLSHKHINVADLIKFFYFKMTEFFRIFFVFLCLFFTINKSILSNNNENATVSTFKWILEKNYIFSWCFRTCFLFLKWTMSNNIFFIININNSDTWWNRSNLFIKKEV